jgi:hypothetical protein
MGHHIIHRGKWWFSYPSMCKVRSNWFFIQPLRCTHFTNWSHIWDYVPSPDSLFWSLFVDCLHLNLLAKYTTSLSRNPTSEFLNVTIFSLVKGLSAQRYNFTKYIRLLHAVFLLGYLSTPRIEVICLSETSVEFHRTTRRYIPDERTLQIYFSSPWQHRLAPGRINLLSSS